MNKIYSLKLMLRAAVSGLIKVSQRILGATSCNAMSLSVSILHSFFVYISCFPSVDSPKYHLARIRQKSMAPNRNPAEIYLLAPHADFSLYPLCLTSLFVFFSHTYPIQLSEDGSKAPFTSCLEQKALNSLLCAILVMQLSHTLHTHKHMILYLPYVMTQEDVSPRGLSWVICCSQQVCASGA